MVTNNNINTAVDDTSMGITERVIMKVKQEQHNRDVAMANYYKTIVSRGNVSMSQACTMTAEYLLNKGYYSITTRQGVYKRLVALGVITPSAKRTTNHKK